jgi:hypothetical protein
MARKRYPAEIAERFARHLGVAAKPLPGGKTRAGSWSWSGRGGAPG